MVRQKISDDEEATIFFIENLSCAGLPKIIDPCKGFFGFSEIKMTASPLPQFFWQTIYIVHPMRPYAIVHQKLNEAEECEKQIISRKFRKKL